MKICSCFLSFAAILRVDVGNQPGTVVLKVTCNKYLQNYMAASDINAKVSQLHNSSKTAHPLPNEITPLISSIVGRCQRVPPPLPSLLTSLSPQSIHNKPNMHLSATLLLRNRPIPSPPSLLLFNHPDNHALVTILHGSRHFQVNPLSRGFHPAEVHYSPETQTISVVPFSDGNMKIAIQDLCLDIGGMVMVGVSVGVAYRVEVTVADKVQVKNSTVACVQVLDSENLPFHVSQLR